MTLSVYWLKKWAARRKEAHATNLRFIGQHCFLQFGSNMDNAQ